MKLLFVAAFVLVASAAPSTEWEQYKEKYHKVYTSKQEDTARYNEYLKTKNMIEEHNLKFEKGESSYSMGINHFSDWFADELSQMLGRRQPETSSGGKPFQTPSGAPVPDSINWVEKGAVTTIKNQGKCGSCYAFSAAGALEGLMHRTNNTITDLSVQELVDCSGDFGCGGGLEEDCFSYVIKRKGIDTNLSYPYTAVQGKCRASEGEVGASCTGYIQIDNENDMTKAVGTVGPVSFAFAVDSSFLAYKGGIFNGTCSRYLNHAMLAVGYGQDEKTGEKYWLVKNSWGVDWGEKGYVRIIRNTNECGMGTFVSYPTYSSDK